MNPMAFVTSEINQFRSAGQFSMEERVSGDGCRVANDADGCRVAGVGCRLWNDGSLVSSVNGRVFEKVVLATECD